jgi:methylglyoxal/glyoxal reductase
MPVIGFGTWQLSEGREVQEATTEALRVGYRLIDTAKLYGNERSVGEVIRNSKIPREEIFVTTKLWSNDQGYENAIEAFEGSLERLGLDYLDLYLIHWPGYDVQRRKDSWRALSELYNEAQVKAVGVSNYEVEHLQELMNDSTLVPAVNQIEFHPFIYEDQQPTLEFCRQQGIVVEAYSPLARGHQLNHPIISALAEEHGKTNAQVMLRWAIQHQTVPIPKSSHAARIKENFEVLDFKLPDQDMEMLNRLSNSQSSL